MKTKRLILISLGLIVVMGLGFFIYGRSAERTIWNELSSLVPAQPLAPAEIQRTFGPVVCRSSHDSDFGHVTLPNGDIWRYAFRSHHVLGTLDSYSIFTGPSGSFRLRGSYFCCEVQLPDSPMPKDSQEFLAFLQEVHPSFDRVP